MISPMTKTHAMAIRQARLERVRMIRRRVVMGAVALFVATWLLITVMLVSGHDPALARSHSAAASGASSGSPSANSGSGSFGSSTSSSGGATSSSTGGFSSSAPSPVTSSQS